MELKSAASKAVEASASKSVRVNSLFFMITSMWFFNLIIIVLMIENELSDFWGTSNVYSCAALIIGGVYVDARGSE